MKIKRRNAECILAAATTEEVEFVRSFLTFKRMKFFGPGPPSEVIDCQLRGKRFPAGFLVPLQRKAKKLGISIKVIDQRQIPEGSPHALDPGFDEMLTATKGHTLWEHQREAVEALISAQNGVAQIPTAGGKTYVAVAFAASLPGRWLYLVSDRVLADQTASAWEAIVEERAGRLLGKGRPRGEKFSVSTFQTMARRLTLAADWLKGVDGVIVDEAHQAPAATFAKVLQAVPAFWRAGMTANAFDRSDEKSSTMVGLLGPVVYAIDDAELAARGVVAHGRVRMVEFEQVDAFWGSYPKAYEIQVVNSRARNELIVDLALKAEKPALVFFKRAAHGKNLQREFARRGISVPVVAGNATIPQRKRMIARMNAGEQEIVLSSKVFNVGVDIPFLRSAVIAAGEKSAIETLQRLGRAMRKAEGKNVFWVWDIMDTPRGGPGCWVADHAAERAKIYRSRGHKVKIIKLR